MREAEEVVRVYKNFPFKKLEAKECTILFDSLNKKLLRFADLYTKTEAANTNALKGSGLNLEHLSRIRLDMRKAFQNLFHVFIGKLISELARRHTLGVKKDLFFYDSREIGELVREGKQAEESEIQKRKAGYAVLKKGTDVQLFLKEEADELWRRVNDLAHKNDQTEIKGMTVFRGVARGKVRIIFQSFNKKVIARGYGMRKGEVLVTDMTKPDMVTACKKAAAIVTDEGGILSHASIIARELKKPCIVGTKIATQALKTGDVVEVDAEQGVVRIVKKKGRKKKARRT